MELIVKATTIQMGLIEVYQKVKKIKYKNRNSEHRGGGILLLGVANWVFLLFT
jgi:hypothetical protein